MELSLSGRLKKKSLCKLGWIFKMHSNFTLWLHFVFQLPLIHLVV